YVGICSFFSHTDTHDVAEGKRWFDNLSAQGQIEMDWQETFWAQGFGKVSDRFGVPWMMNVVKHQPATALPGRLAERVALRV
ncbi:hypothetical protein C9F07_19245, partial [Salmonella enterica subsp. enterica serovar Poona]